MENKVITGKAVQADAIYRAGSTLVNIRPEEAGTSQFTKTDEWAPVIEAVICYDMNMNILWANNYAGHLFATPSDLIKYRKCHEMLCNKASHCAGCPVLRTIETGGEYEARINSSDGKVMFVRSYPLKDGNGFITGAVEIIKDTSNS